MTYQTIIGKTAEIQHTCTVELSKWLELRLRNIFGEHWWIKGVITRLSDEQKQRVGKDSEHDIRNIDLAALLRVLSGNKNEFYGRGLIQGKDRTTISKMFEVRNRWAHLSSERPAIEIILEDMEVIIGFLAIFSSGNDASYHEIVRFAQRLRNEGITDIPETVNQPFIVKKEIKLNNNNGDIVVLSEVRLKSDPNIKGLVKRISEFDGKKKYDVFINGNIKSFYEGQIELVTIAQVKTATIAELLQALTAFQINKPSADSLYSLNSAKVDFVPYQFRPALKIIKSDVPRLLIADGVGVGKTIEAGLILKELQARTALDNVLVICPKPLVAERKWEMEMKDKFGEEFVSIDGATLRNILKDCDRDGEWPSKYCRAIIPYSILSNELIKGFKKNPRILGLEELDPSPHFDFIIVDEAHHIRNSTTFAYKAVKYFCDHADAVIFLTATPLQLGSNDLFTLLNVLFPDKVIDTATFNAMTAPNVYIHKAVRQLRSGEDYERVIELLESAANTDWGKSVISPNPLYSQIIEAIHYGNLTRADRVKLIDSTESLNSLSNMINRTRRIDIADQFCIRDAQTLRSQFTPRQKELHDALIDFEAQVLTVLHGGIGVKFMMSTLRQQAASCIFGLIPSIEVLAHKGVAAITDSYDVDEEISITEEEANTIVSMAAQLIGLSKSLPEEDTKLDKLIVIINEKQKQENNKIILFTTFRHTQRYLAQQIKARTDYRIEIVNGSVKDDDRYSLRERFAMPRDSINAIDILIFTEVGSEGLDYQFCDTLVNYDLPWNPMRIEQRIGRIDRRGQKSEKVHIYNCITDGTIDADIFDRCLMRIGIFEQNIGDCAEIFGELAEGIEKIIFDSALSPEQCAEKLEKLAENEVRNMVEMQRLENESKALFGIDITDFTDTLDRADNPWLSANSVRRLIEGYVEKSLNDGKKHFEGNVLRLSADAKILLKSDYSKSGLKDKMWNGYLKSDKSVCRITFEQDEALDNPKYLFINPLHPLTRQAAMYFANVGEMRIAISANNNDLPSGEYVFSLYSWEYTGERPLVKIVPVCNDELIRSELQNLIQSAIQVQLDLSEYNDLLESLEIKHSKLWEEALSIYKEETRNLCNYKIESLTQSYNQRLKIAETRAIENIREGEIANLKADYNARVERLCDTAKKADIHFSLLVNGVIIIKGDK